MFRPSLGCFNRQGGGGGLCHKHVLPWVSRVGGVPAFVDDATLGWSPLEILHQGSGMGLGGRGEWRGVVWRESREGRGF